MIYFDSCYLAKLYLMEPDSPRVRTQAQASDRLGGGDGHPHGGAPAGGCGGTPSPSPCPCPKMDTRHPRGSGGPEPGDKTGFPLPRE